RDVAHQGFERSGAREALRGGGHDGLLAGRVSGARAYNLTMISRFHFPDRLPAGGEVVLPEALAHHALRVLRLREGEALALFDGEGGEVAARLVVRGKTAVAVLGERSAADRESPL